jgi:hypothetical protein
MKFLEVSCIPAAATLRTVGPAHPPVVSPLLPSGGELLSRVADALHPPELTRAGYGGHMIIQLFAEHMIKVGLAQLCLVDDITLRLDRKVANSIHLTFGPFRLQVGKVAG